MKTGSALVVTLLTSAILLVDALYSRKEAGKKAIATVAGSINGPVNPTFDINPG